MINAQAYLKALHPLEPPPIHLSDEDVAAQLDKEDKHRRRARKSAETRKRKQKEAHLEENRVPSRGSVA